MAGKSFYEILEAQLRTEDAAGPGAGPIALLDAVLEHMPKKIEVLPHAIESTTGTGSLGRSARRGRTAPCRTREAIAPAATVA